MNIPYTKILNSYCIKNVKTEINLELNIDEEDGMDDNLCNIRFYVPYKKDE